MSIDTVVQDTALRLRRLIATVELSRADCFLAEQSLRRLEKPLRMTVFGTDARHAISLLNLMIGQPVISPSIPRSRIQFFHSESTFARLQFRDGTQTQLDGTEFRKLFDDNPSKIRIYLNLPVLKKLSIMVAAEQNSKSLCADVDKTLPAADIALWTGAECSDLMGEVWQELPERLRDHSYLVLSPEMDISSWESIAPEFVDVIRVDPRRAQEAKARKSGVDKAAFKDSGGAQIVKTIKKEIDVLVQSSLDAAEVLLMRYADQIDETIDLAEFDIRNGADSIPDAAPPTDGTAPAEPADLGAPLKPEPVPEPVHTPGFDRVKSTPLRERAYSVPLGKLASRSRLLNSSASGVQPKITPRTVSMAIKNMPKKVSRPISKSSPSSRVRSRRSRPNATPWSLGM